MSRLPSSTETSRFARCVRAFEEEFDYLYRLLGRYGIPGVDAEDLVQEVFAVMWRRWDDFQPDRPLRPWLAGIAIRRAYKYLGRRHREVATGEVHPTETTRASLDDRLDARTVLRRALEQVPETNRSALVLHDLDGMPMPEVARALEIPLATAYTRVGRGRRAFVLAARKLQLRSQPGLRVVLAPEALLTVGREAIAVPAQARARAVERARQLGPRPAPLTASRSEPGLRAPAAFWAAIGTALMVATLVAPRLSAFGARTAAPAPAPAMTAPSPRPPVARPRVVAATGARELPRVPALRAPPESALHQSLGQGLAGYWRFDEGRGSLISHDLSDRRQDCLLLGLDPESAWLEGALGRGVELQRGWIECPQPALLATSSTELSVTGWVRAVEPQPGHLALVARQLGQAADDFFFFGLLDGKLKAWSSLWQWPAQATRPLPLGRWVHVAFSHGRDGSTRLYQDGVLVGFVRQKKRLIERSLLAAPRLTIGSGFNGPGEGQRVQQFSGAIDEVAVYDRALTAVEVAALAAGIQPAGAH